MNTYIHTYTYAHTHTRSPLVRSMIVYWEATKGKESFGNTVRQHIHTYKHTYTHTRLIATGALGDKLHVWQATTGKEALGTLSGHGDAVCGLAISPDFSFIISAGVTFGGLEDPDENNVLLWDVVNGSRKTQRWEKRDSELAVYWLALSPDAKYFATVHENQVIVWDIATQQRVRLFGRHSFMMHSIMWAPNGGFLVCNSSDGGAYVWSVSEQVCVCVCEDF